MDITASMVAQLREKTGLGMMDCKKALTEADGNMAFAVENLRKKGAATAAKRSGKATKEGKVVSVTDGKFSAIIEINCETEPVAKVEDFTNLLEDIKKAVIADKPDTLESLLKIKSGSQTIGERTIDLIGKIGEKIAVSSYFHQTAQNNDLIFSYVHSNGKVGSLIKLTADKNLADNADFKTLGSDIAMQVAAQKPLAIDRDGICAQAVAKEKEICEEQVKNDPKNANKTAAVLEKIAEGKLSKFYKESTLLDQEFIKNDKMSVRQVIDETSVKIGAKISVSAMNMIELGANSVEESEE
ncbi:MAG: translation elongation factor Ts [Chitinispirillales bacterium]|jgi:elongation factor Ts|nr:translation elongation factor Ts [Chitinispirillales bacterium]